MTAIQPLRRDDLPDVASLCELVFRSGSRTPPPGLARYFETTLLDHPWFDPELPSLVYRDEGGRIVGFLGSHVRRLTADGQPLRAAYPGQVMADPEARNKAVGALLLSRYLAGPQDVTLTDTGSEIVRRIWEARGGVADGLRCLGWVRPLRPWGSAGDYALRRFPGLKPLVALVRPVGALVDAAAARLPAVGLGAAAPETVATTLSAEDVVLRAGSLARAVRVRPDYDVQFLEWLLGQLTSLPSRGTPVAALVTEPSGAVLGWYVYFLKRGGISPVLQVVAFGEDAGRVLDHLFHDAFARGAAALQGRLEPELLEPLSQRSCLLHYSGYLTLIHSHRPDTIAALLGNDALVTRLDGDWWMGHHLEDFATGEARA